MTSLERQQAIRLGNTLLAAAGGAVLTLVVAYAYIVDDALVSANALIVLCALFWLVNGAFIAIVKFGLNLRFSDPALTLPQMIWASSSSLLALCITQHWDGAFYLLVLLTMLFGVFRVKVRAFNLYTTYIICLALILVLLRFSLFHEDPLLGSVIYWFTFAFCAMSIARLCFSIMILRNRLRTKNDELEEALKARSYFLANMSHEIRTPMNGVLGMLDIALRGDLSDDQHRYLSIAQSSANGLLTIINDILDFSKIEAGKLHIDPVSFRLSDFVDEILSTFSLRAQEKGLELILDMSADLPDVIVTDPVRLRQMLNNLLGNALKFTEYGEILLKINKDNKGKMIWRVADTGIGIPENKMGELFESFTQADVSTTRQYGGTGLGLAICKQLALLMEGDIEVESQVGEGSQFSIILPLVIGVENQSSVLATPNLTGVRVVVVDDNQTNLLIFKEQLKRQGAYVTLFDAPDRALDYLKHKVASEFDVAIFDMQMPKMDGLELAQNIRTHEAFDNIPIIILTSILEDPSKQRLQSLGINAYLNKPLLPNLLFKTISLVLASPHENFVLGDIMRAVRSPAGVSHSKANKLRECKILLVEDNPTNQDVALLTLNDLGVSAGVASNGREAIEALLTSKRNGEPYHLVLMDCQMPVMDGYAATWEIRQLEDPVLKKIPIIAMTANAMDGDREKCLASGMDDYITKPIQLEILSQAIKRWLLESDPNSAKIALVVDAKEEQMSTENLDWDFSALQKLIGAKPERAQRLLGSFLANLTETADDIVGYLALQEFTRALSEIHALKGGASNLGAQALPAFLAETEVRLKKSEDIDIEDWQVEFYQLVQRLRKKMESHLNG